MKKRSITLNGHATSITLEEEFWVLLKKIARKNNLSVASLIASIDQDRTDVRSNLSSTLRVFVLQQAITDPTYQTTL